MTVLQFYLVGVTLGLLAAPMIGAVAGAEVALATFAGLYLGRLGWRYAKGLEYPRLVGEVVPPAVLWLLSGVGALVLYAGVEDVSTYGVVLEPSTVFLASLVGGVAGVCYLTVFRMSYHPPPVAMRSAIDGAVRPARVLSATLTLQAFDWFVRLSLIRQGLYFNWVAKQSASFGERGVNLWYHIHLTVGHVIIPLLVYLTAVDRRRRWLYVPLIGAQFAIIAAKGLRKDILFAVVILLVSYAMVARVAPNRRLVIVGGVAIGLLFGLVGPTVQGARFLMRRDAQELLSNPTSIPTRFVLEYLPAALDRGTSRDVDLTTVRRQGLMARVGSYLSYASSVGEMIGRGQPLLGLDEAALQSAVLIPRVVFPGKPRRDADAIVQGHFGFGQPGHDTNGTPVTDAFAYLHLLGVGVVMGLAAGCFGLVGTYLVRRHGMLGSFVFVGLLPLFIPVGDSFAGYLGNARNAALFVIITTMLFPARRRTAESRRGT